MERIEKIIELLTKDNIRKFLIKWNELLTIPLAFVLWAFSGPILRFCDPTAGTYDAGVFQKILFTIITLLIAHGFIRIMMKLQWGAIDYYLDSLFNEDYLTHRNLTPYQKICVSLLVFFSLLFCFALLFVAI